jgi:dTDP-4-amino-4,6-dideoxygalactose transaminase
MKKNKNFIHYGMQDLNGLHFTNLKKTLKKQFITNGNICKDFEKSISKLTRSKYTVVCNNGTSALFMTVLACNYKNIIAIVPNINFVAIASLISLVKGKLIF